MILEPFIRLVKLAGRAFYDDEQLGNHNQPINHRRVKNIDTDNRGIIVVVLDALTRRQWIREDDLAKGLKLNPKQLRQVVKFLEQEKLVTRDQKLGHYYVCIDYAQFCDVIRYRLHWTKKKLEGQVDKKNWIQEYRCSNPNCGKKYNALNAQELVSLAVDDGCFRCEFCNGEVVEDMGDEEDGNLARKKMLEKMEVQLRPLIDQVSRVKDLPVPEFGSLQEWERGRKVVEETKIEVILSGYPASSEDDDWVDWEEG